MGKPIIIVENLVKKFEDVTAVDNLSLQIAKGELFGLLGPNGAGKTTTINVLCGLLKPTSGLVIINGLDVQREAAKVKELIGVCPQDTPVYNYLTGRENAELFRNLYGVPEEKLKDDVDALLRRIGLAGDADRRVGQYSGGMKRRLSLVMALVHDPEIAFLDEPTVGMDPQSRHAIWDLILDLKKRGKTIVLTTHYMEEAENICDRVGVIDHGKLIALGSPAELIRQYESKNLEEVFIRLTERKISEDA